MALRTTARQLMQAALAAVEPQRAVLSALRRDDNSLTCDGRRYDLDRFERVRVIGFGKGSAPMAKAAHELLSDRLTDGLVIVKEGHVLGPEVDVSPIRIVEAGHPVPDERGLAAADDLLEFLAGGRPTDLILCLISGGGSALLSRPAEGLSLAHLQQVTRRLLQVGADITEINTVRKHLSAVKGGQLARVAAPATLIGLILSDVGGDQLDVIASGPTVPDPTTYADALAVMNKYGLQNEVDERVRHHLQEGAAGHRPETPKPGEPLFDSIHNVVIANNRLAVEAAVRKAMELGLNAAGFPAFVEGEAQQVAARVGQLGILLAGADDLIKKPAALIFGGETTVTLERSGLGGRNQELALAAAIAIDDQPDLLIATLATDGNDGPTDAAGAFADGWTVTRAQALGLDPARFLVEHDSYRFFEALGDLVLTGPTNTNVNDLIIVLAA